jgi:hypothetical protein
MNEVVGVVIILLAVWPALDPHIETGVVLTIGLALFALSGICIIFNLALPGWMLPSAVVISCAGEALLWRGLRKTQHRPQNEDGNQAA